MVGMMISTTLFAQKSAPDSLKPESKRYERMKRELALTDKQFASVKQIDSKYGKQLREVELKRLEQREAMQTLRLDREREMRKVLTPEQNKKRDEYRAMQKNRQHFGKGKGGHDGRAYKHFRKDRRDAGHERKEKG